MTAATESARRKPRIQDPKPKEGFLKHAAFYGIGTISLQVVSLFLLPLYTHFLTPADYGILQLLYRVGEVLNICLMVGGLQMAALNFWGKAKHDDERQHVGPTIAWLTMAVLSVSAIGVYFGSEFIAKKLGIQDSNLLAWGVVAMMLQAFTLMPLAMMQARMESSRYLISTLSIAICQLVLVTIALVVFDAGVYGVVGAMATTYVLFGCSLTIYELTGSSIWPDVQMLREVVQFSLPFVPGGICLFMMQSGDQFFLVASWNAATLGVYALAYRLARAVAMLASEPLFQVWNARMYTVHAGNSAPTEFGKTYSRILFVFAFVGILAVTFQDEAIRILADEGFAKATSLVAPLVLAHFFCIFANLMDGAFYVTRRTNLKPMIAGASTVVMIGAYALLIPRWAEFGAAYATLIGYVFHWALTTIVAQRTFPVNLEVNRIVITFAYAMVVFGLSRLTPDHLLLKTCYVACFSSVFLVTVLQRNERQWLYRTFAKLTVLLQTR